MNTRIAVATIALAAFTAAPVASHAASLFGHATETSAQSAKGKTVKLTLHNATASPMTVLVDDAPVTLAANSDSSVRAAVGSNIYADDHTTVKLHVTGELSGTTVSFR